MWAPSVRLWAAHFGAGIDSLACLYRRSLLAAHPSDLYMYYGMISEIKVVPPAGGWGGSISFSQSPKRRGGPIPCQLRRRLCCSSSLFCAVPVQSSPVVASLLPVPCLSLPCDATCPLLPTLPTEGH
jgi:hypothetical protein